MAAPAAVGSGDLAAALRPGEAVLRVVSGPRASYAILLKPGGALAAYRGRLDAATLHDEVAALRANLNLDEGLKPFDAPRAHRLYAGLLGPLDAELAGVSHLIVVPDGPLLSLPPAVLVRAAPGTGGDGATAWLGSEVALSVMPTLAALRAARHDLAEQPVSGRSSASATRGSGRPASHSTASPTPPRLAVSRDGSTPPS